MEVYTLDSLLRRRVAHDDFESLIWTERWNDLGDFKLVTKSTLSHRSEFYPGTLLAINNSLRVMVVEETEDTYQDGKHVMTIEGRSLEKILADRAAMQTLNDTSDDPVWQLPGTPLEVAEGMFDYICRDTPFPPALDPGDAIPFLQPGDLLTPGNIPAPTGQIWWEQRPAPLLTAMIDICKAYDFGFRLLRNFDTSELYFEVYTGNDRTTQQSSLTPVIFSPHLDNLDGISEYSSIRDVRNVAYVYSVHGVRTVYAPGYDSSVSGFDRKVLPVDAGLSSSNPPANVQDALEQIGQEELARHNSKRLIDGQITKNTKYVYGVDYDVGDLVELRNQDGITSYKRVTEQIFVFDERGERSYPTFSQGITTENNDWLSLSGDDTTWADYDADTDTHWEDM